MNGRLLKFPGRASSPEEGRLAAQHVLSLPIAEQRLRAGELQLDEPELLLSICAELRKRLEQDPTAANVEAAFLYSFLSEPKRVVGLFDEREYFLGELALLAGTASRALARRDEARRWFDRSEANFRLTVNVTADWSRVSYQRLAILLEERRFEELHEQLPTLRQSFERLDMREDALKCLFLEATAFIESGDLAKARDGYLSILETAKALANERLIAAAKVNLIQVYGSLGDSDAALHLSQEALPLLRGLGLKEYLGKTQWGVGSLLRAKGQLEGAIEAYGSARDEFAALGMVADVAATRLMIADLQLELGNDQAALREVLFALPIVEEYRLVPEGVAALSLLRESVRQQKVNHQALRELHGFFEDSVS